MHPTPLSDTSILIPAGASIDPDTNHQVHLLASVLAHHALPGIGETVPGYCSLVVHYDPLQLTYAQVLDWVSMHSQTADAAALRPPKQVEVPVHYGADYGEDIEFVAQHCGMRVEDVIRLHSQTTYNVYMMGFTPGFAYLGRLPDALITPRLETPRTRVRAGTVAVAGSQTAIYPVDSPGGWRLIGHTSLAPFDPQREPPFLFAPGDMVRFVPDV